MRLFTAIDVSAEVRAALLSLTDALRPTAALAWSPPENWHVTTKFIGDVSDVNAVEQALSHVSVRPFQLDVRGLGWFPNPHQPRVFFAAVKADDAIFDLHRQTDEACATLGIASEPKIFSPHLTLGKIKGVPVTELRRAVSTLPSTEFGGFVVGSFWLYESRPGEAYRKIKEFPLG